MAETIFTGEISFSLLRSHVLDLARYILPALFVRGDFSVARSRLRRMGFVERCRCKFCFHQPSSFLKQSFNVFPFPFDESYIIAV